MDTVTLYRKIISNKFICPITDIEGYEWLKQESNFNAAQEVLKNIGMSLNYQGEKEVFYGANTNPSDSDRKKITADFQNTISQLPYYVEVLTSFLILDDDSDGQSLYMGQRLEHSALVLAANQNVNFSKKLDKISVYTGTEGKSHDVQIDALIQNLKKEGILHLVNAKKKLYQVTGKILYINQVVEYVSENFVPPQEEEQTEQIGLL